MYNIKLIEENDDARFLSIPKSIQIGEMREFIEALTKRLQSGDGLEIGEYPYWTVDFSEGDDWVDFSIRCEPQEALFADVAQEVLCFFWNGNPEAIKQEEAYLLPLHFIDFVTFVDVEKPLAKYAMEALVEVCNK